MAEILLKAGVNDIGISIDGIGKTNDMIRGIDGAYDKSITAVKTLVNLRNKKYRNLNIRLSTTLLNLNLNQIEKIVNMCKDMKIKINFNLPDNTLYFLSGIKLSKLWINDEKKLQSVVNNLHRLKNESPEILSSHVSLDYIYFYFKNHKKKYMPCCTGYVSIYIDSKGNVFSGCWALPPVGNLRNESLREITSNINYIKRLNQMFMKKCPRCSCGYATDLSYDILSIFKQLIYRIKM